MGWSESCYIHAHRARTSTDDHPFAGGLECDDGESPNELRQDQSELLMAGTVLRRMPGAIRCKCRTELNFNNELKGDRCVRQYGRGPQETGAAYIRNGFPKCKSLRSPENLGDTELE